MTSPFPVCCVDDKAGARATSRVFHPIRSGLAARFPRPAAHGIGGDDGVPGRAGGRMVEELAAWDHGVLRAFLRWHQQLSMVVNSIKE